MRKSKKNFLVSLVFALGTLCLCMGISLWSTPVFAEDTTDATTDTTTETTAEDLNDYVVQYYDGFDDGVLTANWYDVSGSRATDGEWTFGEGETAVIWGNGSTADSGKMLYDVGETEFAVAADVKFKPTYDSSTKTWGSVNMHMPILVTTSGTKNAFKGVSVNFNYNSAVFYSFGEDGTNASLKLVDDIGTSADESTNGVTIPYTRVTNYYETYGSLSKWFSVSHNFMVIVSENYLDAYIDGCFINRAVRPDYTKETTVCGIGGNSNSNNGYITIAYDNFTVWTKGTLGAAETRTEELEKLDVIDQLFTAGEYTNLNSNNYDSYITYDTESNKVRVNSQPAATETAETLGAHFEQRIINGLNVSDFSITFTPEKIAEGGANDFIYASAYSGIFLRTSFVNGKKYGYFFSFNTSASGVAAGKLHRMDGATLTNYGTTGYNTVTGEEETMGIGLDGSTIAFTWGEPITITAVGDTFTITSGTRTRTVVDGTYASGSIGMAARTVVDKTGGYSVTFGEFKGKDLSGELATYEFGSMFTAGNYSYFGTENASLAYDDTNGLDVAGGICFNRLANNVSMGDFSITFSLSLRGDATGTVQRTSAATGIYLRASSAENSLIYGYQIGIYFSTGTATPKVNFYRCDGVTSGTTGTSLFSGETLYNKGEGEEVSVTITGKGNLFNITYKNASGEEVTKAVYDPTYASGSIGMRGWTTTAIGGFKLKVTDCKIAAPVAEGTMDLETQNAERLFVRDAYTYAGATKTNAGMTWTVSGTTAAITKGTCLNRVIADLEYDDFTMTYSIEPDGTGTQYRVNNATGIYFRAKVETDTSDNVAKIYGYQLVVAGDDNATPYLYFYRSDGVSGATTATTNLLFQPAPTKYGTEITVTGRSNIFTITYVGSDDVKRTLQVIDDTYASGSIGMTVWTADTTGGLKIVVSDLKLNTLEDYGTTACMERYTVKSYGTNKEVGRVSVHQGASVSVDGFVRRDDVLALVVGGDLDITVTPIELLKAITHSDFYMLDGAAVRLDAELPGLRFETQMLPLVQDLFERNGAEYGTVLLPTEMLGDSELTVETPNVLNIKNTGIYQGTVSDTNSTKVYKYRAAIVNIPASQYATQVSARGYAKFTFGTKEVYLYTAYSQDNNSRSVEYTARKALADTTVEYTDDEIETLEAFAGDTRVASLTDFQASTVNTNAAGYPRLVQLNKDNNGNLYLFANNKYAKSTDGGRTFGAYTTIFSDATVQASRTEGDTTEYPLTQDNGQPFVLSDGRVAVAYRAYYHSPDTSAYSYSSIRVMIGAANGTGFCAPIIIAEHYAENYGDTVRGMWEPYIVQPDDETLLIYFSCDITSSVTGKATIDSSLICDGGRQHVLVAKCTYTSGDTKEECTITRTSLSIALNGNSGTAFNSGGHENGCRYGMSVIAKLADGSYAMVIENNPTDGSNLFDIEISYSKDGITWTKPVVIASGETYSCAAPFIDVLPNGQIVVSYQSNEIYVANNGAFDVTVSSQVNQSRLKMLVSKSVVGYNSTGIEFTDITSEIGIEYETNECMIWNSVAVIGDYLYVLGGGGVNSDSGYTSGPVEIYYAEIY